jgi:hypothetical protein
MLNKDDLYALVDSLPSRHAPLICEEVELKGDLYDRSGKRRVEKLELWRRDVVDVVKDLIGDPVFKNSMAYAPEVVFRDLLGLKRVYDQAWTADWWAEMQVRAWSLYQWLEQLTKLYP